MADKASVWKWLQGASAIATIASPLAPLLADVPIEVWLSIAASCFGALIVTTVARYKDWIHSQIRRAAEEFIAANEKKFMRLSQESIQSQRWEYSDHGYHLHRPAGSTALVLVNDPNLPLANSLDEIHWCCVPCSKRGEKSILQHDDKAGKTGWHSEEQFSCLECRNEIRVPENVFPWDEDNARVEIPF